MAQRNYERQPNPADYPDDADFWVAYRNWQFRQALKGRR